MSAIANGQQKEGRKEKGRREMNNGKSRCSLNYGDLSEGL